MQTFNACAGRTYKLEVWGAEGGESGTYSGSGANYIYGGYGGYSTGVLSLSSEKELYIYVGSKPTRAIGGSAINGGWNGGGKTFATYTNCTSYGGSTSCASGAGGGATDISLNSGSWDSISHLYSRLIVAGGGGGGCVNNGQCNTSSSKTYGRGGGTSGSDTMQRSGWEGGTGGTQTSGGTYYNRDASLCGSLGGFGFGGYPGSSHAGAGGGGGWYGGGPSCPTGGLMGGGGGGSGYVYTSATASNYPGSYGYVNSNYYLTSASTSTSTHTGNGSAKITRQS